ncbi:MAG: hypothetical protein GWP08_19325, partial [Nitrospiraceae bacterium]|nr:hypothetical protein [Nitrospiraceae bacterium]
MKAPLDRWGMIASACVVLAAFGAEASTTGFWIPAEPPETHYRIDAKGELAMAATASRVASGGGRLQGTMLEQVTAAIEALPWTNPGREPFDLFFVALDAELSDVKLWGKLALTLYDAKFYPEAVEAFEKTAELAPEGSDCSWVALVWQGHVHDIAEERERALECYQQALGKCSGDGMKHDQYGMSIDEAWI